MRITGLTPLYDRKRIAARVAELGREIRARYAGEPLVCVCVLRGAFVFFSDLVRAIGREDVTVDFMRISSYGASTESSGRVSLSLDLSTDVRDRNVLVVEDIVDTGRSMAFLRKELEGRGARSIAIAALLDKRNRRVVPIECDFTGFVFEGGFVVGYGLDCGEAYRCLPDICACEVED